TNVFAIDLGYVHLLSPEEIARGVDAGTVLLSDKIRKTYHLTVTTHDLRKYLPDLYWGSYFGKPYVEMFGRDLLGSAPVHQAKWFSEDGVFLQLSESPEDFLIDYEKMEARREAVKVHLGKDAFFMENAPPDMTYRVPKFIFG
ncbi:MAG: hypothetical protein P8X63_08815, partial [Desulfuromonadaceae bacterium]